VIGLDRMRKVHAQPDASLKVKRVPALLSQALGGLGVRLLLCPVFRAVSFAARSLSLETRFRAHMFREASARSTLGIVLGTCRTSYAISL